MINNTSGQGDFNFIHDNSGVPSTSVNPINVSANGEGLAFGDYDNDGDMDFYLNIHAGNNQLWQNNIIASPTNYMKVIPEVDLGSGLTRPALGATVTVSDGCELFSGIQEVSGGIGHGSQNDSRLHFGLPNGPAILYKVEVSFVRPNGGSRSVVSKYVTPNTLTNQTLTVLDTDASDANREPITAVDNVNTDENTLVSIDVQSNDSDPMGESLTTAIPNAPANGTAVLNGNDIDYTPDVGFFGTETFTYTVTNTSGLCATGTVNVTIDAAILPGYDCRKAITVDNTKVGGSTDLSNFPMMVSFTDADIATVANGGAVTNANGYDIVFTAADGTTVLDHEIITYTATTGEYLAWVRIPSLASATNTQTWMYYGNNTIITDPSTDGTWSSDYLAVWHLDDDFLDATTNNNDGTNMGTSDVAGQIADGQDFERTEGDRIEVSSFNITGSELTLSAWINAESFGISDARIISKANGTASGSHWWMLSTVSSGGMKLRFRLKTGSSTTTFIPGSSGLVTGSWFYVTAVYDGSNMILYENGSSVGSTAKTGTIATTNLPIGIGDQPTGASAGTKEFDGVIDEVRVLTAARSAGWLLTEYNNQNDPSTFYTVGPEDCALVLPIELLSFEAEAKTNHVALNWVTASEVDNDFFTIERSRDAKEFTPLFTVPGAGTSSQTLFYEAQDSLPLIGRAFYRLKQTDFDGSFAYSEIVSVTYSGSGAIKIFPNPIHDSELTISFDRETSDLGIDIYDLSGRKVLSSYFNEKPQSNFRLNTSNLIDGIYMIRVISHLGIHYQKLVVE